MDEFILKDFFDNESYLYEKVEGELELSEEIKIYDDVLKLLRTDYRHYIQYVNILTTDDISYSDVFQFSNFDDTNINLVKTLKLAGNSGFSFEEVGFYLLRNKKSVNTKGANIKYGENHSNTARLLGLTKYIGKKVYLTNVGYVFDKLTEGQQKKLLSRLAIRSRLVSSILHEAMRKDVDIDKKLGFLAETTFNRRRNNVRKIFDCVKNNGEVETSLLFSAIHSKEGIV